VGLRSAADSAAGVVAGAGANVVAGAGVGVLSDGGAAAITGKETGGASRRVSSRSSKEAWRASSLRNLKI
jgi:hypothetical protein